MRSGQGLTTQSALLFKHTQAHFGRQMSALRTCDARFGVNFHLVAKQILLHPAFMSAMADPAWDAKLSDDADAKIAKSRVTDKKWWADVKAMMYVNARHTYFEMPATRI